MDAVLYRHSSIEYAGSFGRAVDTVARERKYLAATTGFPAESTIEFIRMIGENDYAQYFALLGDDVIGWCDILPRRQEGFIHVGVLGMGVLPDFRRKGVGRRLLDRTVCHAAEINGIEKIELEVFKSNAGAMTLYERSGFVREGVRVRSRRLDGQYDDVVLMGRFLRDMEEAGGTRYTVQG